MNRVWNGSQPLQFFSKRSRVARIGVLIVVIALLLLSFGSMQNVAYAQGGGGSTQVLIFGGFIPFAFYCTCSGNWLLFVTPPNMGFFSYQFTSQYSFYMLPIPGVWTLGLYNSGGTCTIYVGTGCSTFIPPWGIISPTVGTSFP